KYKKLVARVYGRASNSRQDFLHKLSRKLVNENQVVVVESLHVKGMVRNHNLAKAISDTGWGTFTNFLAYKLE
ncbi:MAG TPA: transposase, partial [Cyanobacteria bacterium UBA11148]|nr:transposase [Cyanobacteria bacterium UBA11148]